ncbi:calcium homeostasis modulator protein 1 [Chanos chanos]|uniref:Calcium homeostasis modulator protein 1 n=1 Tax=Chanos chanos TaxID=29144 RepID=A0A6J2V5R4_CHACN|nr:calcium homeostasis modulator protein 1-like [Chanos chanos]
MDKFRMMFQFLQANQESFMNGICGIMALASAQLYSSFEFSCPCLPEYNYAYGIGILIVPAVWFFLLGFVLNNNISMLTEEWRRPTGKRSKDPSILRYMFCSMTQRALIAPAVWISVTLMDGKSFLCAYSARLDLREFLNESHQTLPDKDLVKLMAKIPCKDVFNGHEIISREAVSRYIRFISQACGWLFLLLMTSVAFMVRAIRPCFTQAAFLKTKYWSHYIDTERKVFDETCREHAKAFAKVCIQQYFESVSGEMLVLHGQRSHKKDKDNDQEHQRSDEEKLLGIRRKEDINKILWDWHSCKPPLNLKKQGNDSNSTNGFANGFHPQTTPKHQSVAYYSKV